MYHSLPPNLQTRIDSFLSLLHQVEAIGHDAHSLAATAPEYRSDNKEVVPGINSIRPVEEREFDAESSLAEAPLSTQFKLDPEMIKEILDSKAAAQNKKSGFKGFLGKLFGK